MAAVAGLVAFFVVGGPLGWLALIAGALIEVGETYLWIRFLRRYKVRGGAEGLIDERAEVVEPLEPTGKVRLLGEFWNAESASGESIAAGEQVIVTEVRGLTLVVRREDGDDA